MRIYLGLVTIVICLLSFTGPSRADGVNAESTCRKIKYKKFIKTHEPSEFALSFRIDGKKNIFEDIGCAVKWRDKQCSSRQGAFDGSAFVYDLYSKKKITALTAVFVRSKKIKTPNGYGIAAFEILADAEKFLAENGGEQLTYGAMVRLAL